MFCAGAAGIIDSCIPCCVCACCSGGEIAFLIFAWFRESCIYEGEFTKFFYCLEIYSKDIPWFFISITWSSVAMLNCGFCSIYLFLCFGFD